MSLHPSGLNMGKDCEVCGKDDLHIAGVVSSSIAPMSLRQCDLCCSLGVEPKWMIEHLAEESGGKDKLIDGIVYYDSISDEYKFHKDDKVIPVTIGRDKEFIKRKDMVSALNDSQ